MQYNAVLRAAGETAPAALKKDVGILCLRNKYTTTLHIINSSVVKLGKLTTAGTVIAASLAALFLRSSGG